MTPYAPILLQIMTAIQVKQFLCHYEHLHLELDYVDGCQQQREEPLRRQRQQYREEGDKQRLLPNDFSGKMSEFFGVSTSSGLPVMACCIWLGDKYEPSVCCKKQS